MAVKSDINQWETDVTMLLIIYSQKWKAFSQLCSPAHLLPTGNQSHKWISYKMVQKYDGTRLQRVNS